MIHNYRLQIVLAVLFAVFVNTAKSQVAPAAKPAAAPVKLLFEKVYIHTDREYYTAGDDIWFKAYLVDAQTNLLNNSSNNLHVELITPQAQVFNAEVVNLTNGTGTGDFRLSDSIPAGNYRLRAYTNWMLNFGNSFIFEKNITVYNTAAKSKPITTIIATNAALKPASAQNGPVIRFFPEGGSMVEGAPAFVAFKVESPGGDVKAKGAVVSSTGDTVSHFESTPQGMGLFVFVPDPGKTYTAKGFFNDKQPFSTVLPAALAKGYVLHVSESDSAHLKLTISTNQATMADNPGKEVTLMARHAGTRFLNGPVKFVFLQISANVAKKQFPAGVSSITIYDNQQRPQSERLVYISDSMAVKALSVKTDKQSYGVKEKVTVTVNTTAQNKPVRANLSMAVVDASAIPVNEGNIASYLTLQSEIAGTIAHPERYFDTTNTSRARQLDLLLMTQGWRDFVWRRLADEGIHITHATENGFGVSGSLRQKFANKPIPNVNVTLTVKGETLSAQYLTRTDSVGKYAFRDIPIAGKREVAVASFDDKKKKVGWIQLDSAKKDVPPITVLPEYTGDPEAEAVFEKAAIAITKTKSKLSDTVKLKEVKITGSKFTNLMDQTVTKFGYPDFKYDITSKYYSYNSVRDFILHEVPGARTDPSKSGDSVVFSGMRFDANKNHDVGTYILPRFIVNKHEDSDDLNNGAYLDLSMDKVNSILVRHVVGLTLAAKNDVGNYRTGSGGDVYLIFMDIKDNAFDKVQFNVQNAVIDGYYQARTFYKPLYDGAADKTKADERTTIHWEPTIITDANGQATVSFFNADPKTKIRVVVEGLTEKGVPIAGGTGYVVK